MLGQVFTFLHLGEAGWYVLLTVLLAMALVTGEIVGLKNRRRRAYQTLIREARARRSEMHLRID